MKVIDWLMGKDLVIQRLCAKYLLKNEVPYTNDGYIGKYLAFYDPSLKMWGGGIYSPKWISSHYTLLELKYMEIDPSNPIFREAALHVLKTLWYNRGQVKPWRHTDLCVAAMIVSILAYARIQDERIFEIIDYILQHRFSDGGWNCMWESKTQPKKSSLHTTLTVLEAFRDYEAFGYSYRLDEIKKIIPEAEEFILKKRLFRSVSTQEVIHPDMSQHHYPPRWKYDYFRALEYFQSVDHLFDERMKEGLEIVRKAMEKGYLGTGKPISGKIHFRLEPTKYSGFNTLRALKILKHFDPEFYKSIVEKDFDFSKS